MLKQESILSRVFGLLLVTLALVYIGLSLFFTGVGNSIVGTGKDGHDAALEPIKELARRIQAESLLDPAKRRELDALIREFRDSPLFFRVSILDRRYTVISSTEESWRDVPVMDEFVRYAVERGRSYPVKSRYGTIDVVEEAYPLSVDGTIEGALLAARYPAEGIREITSRAPRISIGLFLTFGLLLAALIGFYIYRFFHRLSALTGAVSNLARGDLSTRVSLSPDSELGLIAESFNKLAENYEGQMRKTKDLAERQVRDAQTVARALESSNREKERNLKLLAQMAGGMAHEVRNPLGGIRGFAELLKNELRKAGTGPEDKRLRYVDSILKEVHALEGLVQSVLDFARPRLPAFAPTPLEAIVESFRPALEHRVAELAGRGIAVAVEIHVEPGLAALVVDPGQLRQLFLNLTLNACDALEAAGGKVRFAARRATPEEAATVAAREALPPGAAPSAAVTFTVADTGEGMDPETRENLFTPFFTTKARGTGLGLSICHRIVEIHGGAIAVASEKGVGTTFTIVLPSVRAGA